MTSSPERKSGCLAPIVSQLDEWRYCFELLNGKGSVSDFLLGEADDLTHKDLRELQLSTPQEMIDSTLLPILETACTSGKSDIFAGRLNPLLWKWNVKAVLDNTLLQTITNHPYDKEEKEKNLVTLLACASCNDLLIEALYKIRPDTSQTEMKFPDEQIVPSQRLARALFVRLERAQKAALEERYAKQLPEIIRAFLQLPETERITPLKEDITRVLVIAAQVNDELSSFFSAPLLMNYLVSPVCQETGLAHIGSICERLSNILSALRGTPEFNQVLSNAKTAEILTYLKRLNKSVPLQPDFDGKEDILDQIRALYTLLAPYMIRTPTLLLLKIESDDGGNGLGAG